MSAVSLSNIQPCQQIDPTKSDEQIQLFKSIATILKVTICFINAEGTSFTTLYSSNVDGIHSFKLIGPLLTVQKRLYQKIYALYFQIHPPQIVVVHPLRKEIYSLNGAFSPKESQNEAMSKIDLRAIDGFKVIEFKKIREILRKVDEVFSEDYRLMKYFQ